MFDDLVYETNKILATAQKNGRDQFDAVRISLDDALVAINLVRSGQCAFTEFLEKQIKDSIDRARVHFQ